MELKVRSTVSTYRLDRFIKLGLRIYEKVLSMRQVYRRVPGRSTGASLAFSNKLHSNFSSIGTNQKEMPSKNLLLDAIVCWITTILLNGLESGDELIKRKFRGMQ